MIKVFPFYECASGCGCREGDGDGNHPGAQCVWEKYNRKFVDVWFNPSWHPLFNVSEGWPRGINVRFGKMIIQFFGIGNKLNWYD